MALLAGDVEGGDSLCDTLGSFCDEQDMAVNVPKSMCVTFRPFRYRGADQGVIRYRGQELQQAQSFKYLGITVSGTRWLKDCLSHNTVQASRAMWTILHKQEQTDNMPACVKMNLFDVAVKTVADYGCHVWGVQYLDWRSEHTIFRGNPFQMLALQYLRIISGAHSRTSRWVLLREFNKDPVQVDWAVRCAGWWNKNTRGEARDLARMTMQENIMLFKEGCKVCWTYMFLKSMLSLGLGGERSLEELRDMELQDLGNITFSEDSIRAAYREKYNQLFWDTHCLEPRHRGGRHAAFIKHNCWFHTDDNPALKMLASDTQVRSLLKFRLGTHRLRCNDHGLDHRQRTCQVCDGGVVEDEVHAVLDCPAYDEIRSSGQFKHLFWKSNTGMRHNSMKDVMHQQDQYGLSRYITVMLKRRSHLLNLQQTLDEFLDPELQTQTM